MSFFQRLGQSKSLQQVCRAVVSLAKFYGGAVGINFIFKNIIAPENWPHGLSFDPKLVVAVMRHFCTDRCLYLRGESCHDYEIIKSPTCSFSNGFFMFERIHSGKGKIESPPKIWEGYYILFNGKSVWISNTTTTEFAKKLYTAWNAEGLCVADDVTHRIEYYEDGGEYDVVAVFNIMFGHIVAHTPMLMKPFAFVDLYARWRAKHYYENYDDRFDD